MSEEAKEAPAEGKKKGGSKLPMIVALVMFLAGGGFFMMKGKGAPAAKKVEAPVLGAIEPVKEMLVNLAGGTSYLKIEVALHMVKDFKKEELEKNKEAVTDSILLCLKSKKLSDIQSPDQLKALKEEIAENVNKILEAGKDPKDADKDADKSKDSDSEKKDGDKKDGDKDKSKDGDSKSDRPKLPDGFDSAKGPVLKVYFTSFATQ